LSRWSTNRVRAGCAGFLWIDTRRRHAKPFVLLPLIALDAVGLFADGAASRLGEWGDTEVTMRRPDNVSCDYGMSAVFF